MQAYCQVVVVFFKAEGRLQGFERKNSNVSILIHHKARLKIYIYISIYIIEYLYRFFPFLFFFLSPICSFPFQADLECGYISLRLKMLTFLGKYL